MGIIIDVFITWEEVIVIIGVVEVIRVCARDSLFEWRGVKNGQKVA
jgi:hypothetical protein